MLPSTSNRHALSGGDLTHKGIEKEPTTQGMGIELVSAEKRDIIGDAPEAEQI